MLDLGWGPDSAFLTSFPMPGDREVTFSQATCLCTATLRAPASGEASEDSTEVKESSCVLEWLP